MRLHGALHKSAAVPWADLIYIAMSIPLLTAHAGGWGDVRLIIPHLSVTVLLDVLLTHDYHPARHR